MSAREIVSKMESMETELRQDVAVKEVFTEQEYALYSDWRKHFGLTPAQAFQDVVDVRSGRKSVDYLPTMKAS